MFKKDFPLLASDVIYLDSAASAQKPKQVLKTMDEFYKNSYSNVHRGTCHLANVATIAYEKARESVASFLNAKAHNIVFTKGATEAINLVASGYAQMLKPGDEVLVSVAEHHANFVPWQQACLRSGATFKVFNILPDGRCDLDDFKAKLTKNTRIVAVSGMSNVLGVLNPVQDVIIATHKIGAKVLLDVAQSIAHEQIDVQKLNCDFLAFSGHKLYGPTGIGVLYGTVESLDSLPPYQFGGEMIDKVKIDKTTFAPIPARFEAGTPPIVEAIGLASAIEYVNEIGFNSIQKQEKRLFSKLIKRLQDVEDIQFLGEPQYKSGLVSFNVKGIHPNDLSAILSHEKVCVRVGHHCAMPLHTFLGITASLRVSLGLYNNEKDVDSFVSSLKKAIGFFK